MSLPPNSVICVISGSVVVALFLSLQVIFSCFFACLVTALDNIYFECQCFIFLGVVIFQSCLDLWLHVFNLFRVIFTHFDMCLQGLVRSRAIHSLGHVSASMKYQFSSLAQSCLTPCDPMDYSTPGFPVHHQLPQPTQTHVHWVGDAIQPSHPLLSPSPPTFSLSQHQGFFKWVSSSHQVTKVLEFQL